MFLFVTQSFGNENEYRRALFAILSFKACLSRQKNFSILNFTDNIEWFERHFKDIRSDYILLTEERIKGMRGSIDFLHRMKIAIIEEAFLRYPGYNILYADSDTFCIGDVSEIIAQLDSSKTFMHKHEYQFKELKDIPLPAGKPFKAFLDLINTRSFILPDGGLLKISEDLSSWNAGVMIMHYSHVKYLKNVYALTDQFYPATHNHASEQYAFSIIFQNETELSSCDKKVYHYWYRVKKRIIDIFLKQKMDSDWQKLEMEKKLDAVRKWASKLPDIFDTHILTLRDNAIQAFNEGKYRMGYKWAARALVKQPFTDLVFIKDVIYHIRRQLRKG